MSQAPHTPARSPQITRAVILLDGLDRERRLPPSDDHPAFQVVNGLPIADRLVRHLASQGITDLRFVLHHLPGLVTHYFADGTSWGTRITYFYQERPLGSGGALAQSQDFCTETTLVLPGALLTDVSISPMAAAHHAANAGVTVALGVITGASLRPWVAVDEKGRVLDYLVPRHENEGAPSPHHVADVGLYLIEPATVRGLTQDAVLDWSRDVMPSLVRSGRVYGWRSDAWFALGTVRGHIPVAQGRQDPA